MTVVIKLLPSLLKLDNDQINFHIIDARFVLGILIILGIVLGDSIGIIILIILIIILIILIIILIIMMSGLC